MEIPGDASAALNTTKNDKVHSHAISALVLPPQYQFGSISVTSEPSGATIGLETPDGPFVGPIFRTPYKFDDVSIGDSTITVSLEGYYEWSKTVQVQVDQTRDVHAQLIPRPTPTPTPTPPGAIYITSIPTGASICLDGQCWGMLRKTPDTLQELVPGYHTVELCLAGYKKWSKEVYVTADETKPVHATLTPETPSPTTGSIKIDSSPSGATVELDGQTFVGPISATPAMIPDLDPGRHTVKLSHDGYYDWGPKEVYVTAGETTPVHATMTPIPPPPTTGAISVQSSPSGATIKLDDYIGPRTPYTFTTVSPGRHKLVLSLDGYYDWPTNVDVVAGRTTPVYKALIPIPSTGAILVISEPPGANIGLDGVAINALTPYTIPNVAAGTHTLVLALKGYLDWSAKVQVVPGKTAEVDAPLIPRPIRAGIYMNNASNCVIISNRILNCGQGIWIVSGSANRIEGNKIQNNSIAGTGVRLESGVINTGIHENCFIDNVPQAWDDGTYNNWVSNFWSQPPGGTGNYTIPGAGGSADTDHLDVCPLT